MRFSPVFPLLIVSYATCAHAAVGATAIEEIIVTAKNRSERLQDVPLSVSAFTTETLQQNQIFDVRDLQRIAPSLSVYSFTGRADPSGFALRGVAPNTSDERYQGIAFFLDGIALSGQLASFDVSQLERIEVIKGPQSATFGRATYSGAINYITRDPSGDAVSGEFRLRAGSTQRAQGMDLYGGGDLSFPVVRDRLWADVQVVAERNAALFHDHNDGSPIGEEKTTSAALTLLLKPSDDWKIKTRFEYDHDHDSAPATYAEHARDWLLAGVPTVVLPRASGSLWPTVVPDPQEGYTIDGNKNPSALYEPDSGNVRDRYLATLAVSYSLSGTELSYRSGYFYSDDQRALTFARRGVLPGQHPVFGNLVGTGAVTLSPTATSITSSREVFQNTSHQLMAVSDARSRFRWRLGGYFFYESDKNWQQGFISASNPSGQQRGLETIRNIAGFGAVDYDLTPRLTLSGEARLAQETVGWDTCTTCGQVSTSNTERKSTDFLPRATIDYKVAPESHIYFLYSYGTKSGRFSFASVGGQPSLFYADPETLSNFELGSKNAFWDGKAILNIAAYYQIVKKQQLTTSMPVLTATGALTSINTTQNVGTSHIPGFELESQVKVSPGITLNAGLGYAGQHFVNQAPISVSATTAVLFPGAVGAPIVIAGNTQASIPKWNGSVGVTAVDKSLIRDLDLRLHIDADYRGKMYADLANIAVIPASWKVNARLGIGRDAWEIALFVRNLLNDRTALGSGLAGNATACTFIETNTARFGANQQCLFVAVARPRQIGMEANVKF